MSIEALSWAWQQPLKPGPKLVLLALADHADHKGICWPGQEGLAEKTGMNRSTVIENIRKLVELDLVEVEKRADEQGRRTSNRYILRMSKVGKSNVGKSNMGKAGTGLNVSVSDCSEKEKAKVGKSNVGKTHVGFSAAKVGNPDTNHQLEPSLPYRSLRAREDGDHPPDYQPTDHHEWMQWFANLGFQQREILSAKTIQGLKRWVEQGVTLEDARDCVAIAEAKNNGRPSHVAYYIAFMPDVLAAKSQPVPLVRQGGSHGARKQNRKSAAAALFESCAGAWDETPTH